VRLDQTAAAYGLFQVVYTDLTERLAFAVFELRKRNEPTLRFENVFAKQYKHLLGSFRDLLKQIDGDSFIADSVAALRAACDLMSDLGVWRNDRLHARVRMTEDGYVLYDWKTCKRLSISYEELDGRIQQAIKAAVELEVHLVRLLRSTDFEVELERTIRTLLEQSDETH
jgi:hypothetical protein